MNRRDFFRAGAALSLWFTAGCSEVTESRPDETDDTSSAETSPEPDETISGGTDTDPVTDERGERTAEGGTTRSGTAIEGSFDSLECRFDGLGNTVLDVSFEYTVYDDFDREPVLTVTDGSGRERYSERRTDDETATIEIPATDLAIGAMYTAALSDGDETVASTTADFSGFELAIEETNLDGMTVQEYTGLPEEDPVMVLSNVGDMPAEVDEIAVLVGPIPLDAVFTIGSEPFPAGATKEFSGSTLAELSAGTYEMAVEAKADETTIASASTTVELDKSGSD